MATTPNKNAVPSEDYANMRFNAGKFDEFMTSTASSYVDRMGVTHLTVAGIQQSVIGALIPENNLSDVQSAATSRTNLGLGTVAVESIVPVAKGGTGNATGLAATATALATSRTFQTNLAITTAVGFTGAANNVHGVTGTLPIANGGTGATTAAAALTSLGAKANAGVTDASSASAGVVGEVITATTLATSIATGVITQAASITLTPGDWDVMGCAHFNTTTATLTALLAGIGTTSGAITVFPNGWESHLNYAANLGESSPHLSIRLNITSNTTVYLNAQCAFASGTVSVDGFIRARRIR